MVNPYGQAQPTIPMYIGIDHGTRFLVSPVSTGKVARTGSRRFARGTHF
jgi:hypothetical protein